MLRPERDLTVATGGPGRLIRHKNLPLNIGDERCERALHHAVALATVLDPRNGGLRYANVASEAGLTPPQLLTSDPHPVSKFTIRVSQLLLSVLGEQCLYATYSNRQYRSNNHFL